MTGSVVPGASAAGCTTEGTSLASWDLTGSVLTIRNTAGLGIGSVITGISFDAIAGQTVSLSALQGPGVLYTTGGGANLPASLGWSVDFDFSPDKHPTSNGINAGESLAFDLSGVSLTDVRSGAFKFGVHIQALTGDRSEKLINMTPAVPEPESYAMVLAGVVIVGGVLRRRQLQP
ncbi:MAG TPA: PEP-CTERM sorting domain-containing protein [Aquabacterium sp.]|uniref:PEP-CTERM sorting domain-containing protein n=1 Tax=Aquabacterium sp. TaxID=1872578 RepID=UPI002E32F09A|nr:PEP-CTERM sorting domain-containing protein [Aquabacterium sp.]HEX5354734.1 PEP-CTERM sorting domain-containing protein [Aquabacterium sp.]